MRSGSVAVFVWLFLPLPPPPLTVVSVGLASHNAALIECVVMVQASVFGYGTGACFKAQTAAWEWECPSGCRI
jgi:hypothetical protein